MDRGFNARESAAKPRANCVYAIQIPRVPTILAVGYEEGFAGLAEALQLDGYLVLVVSNFDDALHVIKTHSRPIHVLVTYASANAPDWTTIVKPFRLDDSNCARSRKVRRRARLDGSLQTRATTEATRLSLERIAPSNRARLCAGQAPRAPSGRPPRSLSFLPATYRTTDRDGTLP